MKLKAVFFWVGVAMLVVLLAACAPGALALTALAVGICAFLLFAVAEPAGGLVAAALAAGTYLLVATQGRRV